MRQRISPPILLIELVIGVVLLLAVAAGALAWRVTQSPLELDRLTPFVEQALENRFPGLNARIGGGVYLAWDAPDQALTLLASEVSIGPAGGAPLSVPELSLSFDRIRLLRGELSPKAITLVRPRFEIERGPTGVWRLAGLEALSGETGTTPPPPGTESAPAEQDWITRSLRGGGSVQEKLVGLDRLGVRGASVLIRDQPRGLSAAVEGLDFNFRRLDGVWTATTSGHAAAQAVQAAFDATATLGTQGWTARGSLKLDPTELAALRRIADAYSTPEATLLPVETATLEGRVSLSVAGGMTWDGSTLGSLKVLDLNAEAHAEALSIGQDAATGLSGRVERADLTANWAGAGQALQGALKLGPAVVAHPEIPAGSVEIRSADLSAHYDMRADAVRDLRVEIDSALTTLSLTGSIDAVSGPMAATVQAKVGAVSFDDLRKFWPTSLAVNPRRWMLANISRGAMSGAAAKAVIARVGPDQTFDVVSLDGTMEASGLRIQYVPRMPPVEQAAGSAKFDLTKFEILLHSGVALRQRLQKGRIDITGLELKDQDIAFDLALAGPLSSALEILDSPPLGYIKRFGVPLNEPSGEVTTRLLVKFPLLNRITFDDVKISATSEATGVRFARLVEGMDVTDGALQVKVDQNDLALTGRVNVLGAPFVVDWAESFAKAPAQRRTLTVSGVVEAPIRQALGLESPKFLRGPVGMKLVYVGLDGRRARASTVFDLQAADLTVEQLGYAKPAGMAAELRLETSLLGVTPQTADLIRFTSEGATASGRGRFSPDGALNRLDLDRLRMGETDVALSFLQSAEGVLISAVGAKLDLRPVLKDKPGKPAEPTQPTRFDVKVAAVRIADDILFANVEGRVEHDGVKTRSAELSARAAGGLIRAVVKPGQSGRDVLINADDAGTLLQALGVTQSMRGGRLRLTGWYDDRQADSPMQGRVEINDSRVVGAPILSRLLQLASITGIPELLSGEGVAFQTIQTDFTMTDAAIDVKEARASGLALGVLLRGKVDRVKDVLDLSGTLVPIYGFNRVLGAIPLLGDLLTGGDGGGLFAFTFAVRGPAANPDVSVNPLSVLAPGMLRRLFEYAPGGDPVSPAPTAPAFPKRDG